ncbi:DUF1501 domain-containing protein [Acidobacteria bacterium AH-259-D05]|nr:DUF1501 domain-containing protein [Acidobacteria bacterium AH-259-D05]
MHRSNLLKSRRDFLKDLTLISATLSAPSFLVRTLKGAQMSTASLGNAGRILVVVELAGGCDGLNTIVPYTNDFYYQKRPTLAIDPKTVLALDDQLGFHPSLTGFKELYDGGNMAIVQGVGYPNPNRSHFRSRDIWHTAEAEEIGTNGWLAKYFDDQQSSGSLQGINIGGRVPKAMISEAGSSPSIRRIDTYKLQTDARYPEDDANKNAAFQSILSEPATQYPPYQEYVTKTVLDATFSSAQILEGQDNYHSTVEYPDTAFANHLRTMAQIIAADIGVRVFYATISGFDTHASQADPSDNLQGTHADLLETVSLAIKAFLDDMKEMGRGNDVLIMSFSEFGRRVSENASDGTDHGTANQMFLFGGLLNPGFYGEQPSLASQDLDPIGDMIHNVDFRSVYSTVLANWLEVDPVPLIGESWPLLGLL